MSPAVHPVSLARPSTFPRVRSAAAGCSASSPGCLFPIPTCALQALQSARTALGGYPPVAEGNPSTPSGRRAGLADVRGQFRCERFSTLSPLPAEPIQACRCFRAFPRQDAVRPGEHRGLDQIHNQTVPANLLHFRGHSMCPVREAS